MNAFGPKHDPSSAPLVIMIGFDPPPPAIKEPWALYYGALHWVQILISFAGKNTKFVWSNSSGGVKLKQFQDESLIPQHVEGL